MLVDTDPGMCAVAEVTLGTPIIDFQQVLADGVVAVTNDAPSIFPVGETIVTWTITDIEGNRTTCTQTVTIIDGHYFEIDMLGKITAVRVNCPNNLVAEDYVVSDFNDRHFLEIESGTAVFCGDGNGIIPYPEIIVMSLSGETPPIPDGMARLCPVYEFTGYSDKNRHDLICPRVTFNSAVTVILSYDPDELPPDASSPFIAYYDTEQEGWVKLAPAPGRVAEVGKAAGRTNRFSMFSVLVEVPSANFVLSDLNIVPSVNRIGIGNFMTFAVWVGENASVTAGVANNGNQEGTYSANLRVNQQLCDTTQISLIPGQSRELNFAVVDNEPGQYVVQLGSLSGEFRSWVWINWWLIGGLSAIFVLLCWLVWYYAYYQRRL